jgi:pyruvate/2-oxoglutarate dehydrogenase complex dihydrolipoamide acyltransferase (E2) component
MKQDQSLAGCRVQPFPDHRRQQVDWLDLMQRHHIFHALVEMDVTETRQSIREYRARTHEPLSLTACVVWCVAQAVDRDRRMHAYRKGRRQIVLFDDVDVAFIVERTVEGEPFPIPFIIRAANRKSPEAIHQEIRHAQQAESRLAWEGVRWLPLWLALPGFLRRFVWSRLLANPHWRRITGTVLVTAVGMFGRGPAWGIPLTNYTLWVTVGGIARKPGVVRESSARENERIEVREYLSLTLSMDHDIIDGAPAARFVSHLRELIESGAGLRERHAGPAPDSAPASH